jgi:hypothetical protein
MAGLSFCRITVPTSLCTQTGLPFKVHGAGAPSDASRSVSGYCPVFFGGAFFCASNGDRATAIGGFWSHEKSTKARNNFQN